MPRDYSGLLLKALLAGRDNAVFFKFSYTLISFPKTAAQGQGFFLSRAGNLSKHFFKGGLINIGSFFISIF